MTDAPDILPDPATRRAQLAQELVAEQEERVATFLQMIQVQAGLLRVAVTIHEEVYLTGDGQKRHRYRLGARAVE